MIDYNDFAKIELKVAKIKSAEKIENSEKLLKLQVDLGNEERQIVAGIGKQYTSEELVGREIIIIANLESRALMGHESQGMLLAASGEDGPVLLQPDSNVPPGSSIH